MKTDFLIIGSGIAGLSLALKLSQLGEVVVLTKKGITSGSTGLAQGGIAGVRNPQEDSAEEHFRDTMKAGAYHNNEEAVRLVVENGEQALKDLEQWGVRFDFSLHREGGHTYARIFHVADETGRVVQEVLAEEVTKTENITVLENAFVTTLFCAEKSCFGASFQADQREYSCFAQRTILATGGAGQIYEKTTNPAIITGDGMALALEAGAALRDMEFIQFHPTALDMARDPLFLLSEALRGFGALIVTTEGERFVDEMQPRDIVARAIFAQQQASKKVFLDLRHHSEAELKRHFPMIFDTLLSFQLNLARDLIPITPAAHFFCGGVKTDLWGQTAVQNLFALGEVACTGLHGANRLASNSLLEGVVFADQIFQYCEHNPVFSSEKNSSFVDGSHSFIPETEEDILLREKIQHTMQEKCGVVRSAAEMQEAQQLLVRMNPTGTETKNLLQIAQQVIIAALARETSLGCHYRSDF